MFVGRWAPESAGDYATGANHVLPTGGLARACGPLAVETFGKFLQVQRLTREGLASLLHRPGFAVVCQAGDSSHLLTLVRENLPDLVLVDIRMPPTHTIEGLDAAGIIRQEHPDTSAYNDPEIAWRLDQRHHAGLVVAAPSYERVQELIDSYVPRFFNDFHAVQPPLEKPAS